MQVKPISKPGDDPHDVVVVAPDAVRVAPSDEELSSLLQQAARHRSDSQTPADADESSAGPAIPPVDTSFRAAAVGDVQAPPHRRSMGRGAIRTFTALLLAGSIAVTAFAWRSWGDTAQKQIAKWATQAVLTATQSPDEPAPAAEPVQPEMQAAANAESPQPAPVAETAQESAPPAAAAPSPDSTQLLQSMARDVASLGQEVEQLKASIAQLRAGQEQMSRDVAKAAEIKASEIKTSAPNVRPRKPAPSRAATAPARKLKPPPRAVAAPSLPQSIAPYVPPPQPQPIQRQADPELASVPRPPMPLR